MVNRKRPFRIRPSTSMRNIMMWPPSESSPWSIKKSRSLPRAHCRSSELANNRPGTGPQHGRVLLLAQNVADRPGDCHRPDAWGRVSFLTIPRRIDDSNHSLAAGMDVDVPDFDGLLISRW